MKTSLSDNGVVQFNFVHLTSDISKIRTMNDEQLVHHLKMALPFQYKITEQQHNDLDVNSVGTLQLFKSKLNEIFAKSGYEFNLPEAAELRVLYMSKDMGAFEKVLKSTLPIRKFTLQELLNVRKYGTYILIGSHPQTVCKMTYFNSSIGMTEPIYVIGRSGIFIDDNIKNNHSKISNEKNVLISLHKTFKKIAKENNMYYDNKVYKHSKAVGRVLSLENALKKLCRAYTYFAKSHRLTGEQKKQFNMIITEEIRKYYYESIERSKVKKLFLTKDTQTGKLSTPIDFQQNQEKSELLKPQI
jgi:hypothetical protein